MKTLPSWSSFMRAIFTSNKTIQVRLAEAKRLAVGPVAYSLEVFPNRTIIGVKTQNCHPESWIIDAPMSTTQALELWEYMTDGDELVGLGNLSHDTYIVQAVLDGASPKALHKLSLKLKSGQAKKQVPNRIFGIKPLAYNELDLKIYEQGLELKYLQHMKSFASSISLSETKMQRNEVDMACIANLEWLLNAVMKEFSMITDWVRANRESEFMAASTGEINHA